MAIFNTRRPTYSNWQWFKSIVVRVIFPPIIAWDLAKLGINKLLGTWVGSLVLLPTRSVSSPDIGNLNSKKPDLIHEKHIVITYDSMELDTLEIRPKSCQDAMASQKYIINFVGRGDYYKQFVHRMQDDAEALNANVIGFNFRGVGDSTGYVQSKDDLVIDGIAQVQRLLDQGIPSLNIILKGHSLGAGVASLVAYHFYQLGQPIYLFNNRSFSSITNYMVAYIRTGFGPTGHEEFFIGKLLGWLAKPFIKFGLALTKWEINAGDAFNAIPEEYRDYILVRTNKAQRRTKVVWDDPDVRHYASIHLNVPKTERTKEKRRRRKLIGPDDPNGHNTALEDLKNVIGQTGDDVFREFVITTGPHASQSRY
jgi:hypothetical protein